MKAPEILTRAAQHMSDRAATYDKPEGERSMGKTVAAFNAITGRDLTESEGWLLMTLLKFVRDSQRNEPHQNTIAHAVEWAKTSRGGRQYDFLRTQNDGPMCSSIYGLCE